MPGAGVGAERPGFITGVVHGARPIPTGLPPAGFLDATPKLETSPVAMAGLVVSAAADMPDHHSHAAIT
ncbi:hypothetical protein THIX_10185 [Thiomonas sp. X19]|nr:hypothetical protein THIX_10185 [Thiomonas sp. X19]